jgi:hypothetical protein
LTVLTGSSSSCFENQGKSDFFSDDEGFALVREAVFWGGRRDGWTGLRTVESSSSRLHGISVCFVLVSMFFVPEFSFSQVEGSWGFRMDSLGISSVVVQLGQLHFGMDILGSDGSLGLGSDGHLESVSLPESERFAATRGTLRAAGVSESACSTGRETGLGLVAGDSSSSAELFMTSLLQRRAAIAVPHPFER